MGERSSLKASNRNHPGDDICCGASRANHAARALGTAKRDEERRKPSSRAYISVYLHGLPATSCVSDELSAQWPKRVTDTFPNRHAFFCASERPAPTAFPRSMSRHPVPRPWRPDRQRPAANRIGKPECDPPRSQTPPAYENRTVAPLTHEAPPQTSAGPQTNWPSIRTTASSGWTGGRPYRSSDLSF